MASYENVSPLLLARLFERQVGEEMRKILDEYAKEIIDKAVKEAVSTLQANAEVYRAYDRMGDDIRITLIDKREKNG